MDTSDLKTQAWEQGIFGVEKACFRGWDLGLEHGKFGAQNAFGMFHVPNPNPIPENRHFPPRKCPVPRPGFWTFFPVVTSFVDSFLNSFSFLFQASFLELGWDIDYIR